MWLPATAQAPLGDVPGAAVRVDGLHIIGLPTDFAPPAAGDLDTWQWQQYSLSWDLASKLGFAVGSADASLSSRVLVAEFSRSKTVEGDRDDAATARVRYGVAARLVVQVREIKAGLQLTLPAIAAQAQVNNIEARANMTIEGYTSGDAGTLFPPFSTFDVETYVKLMEAMTRAKEAIGKDPQNIHPIVLWRRATEVGGVDLTASLAASWALTRIANGHSLLVARDQYRERGDSGAADTITAVYSALCGELPQGEKPQPDAMSRAKELLHGYELHVPHGRDLQPV